MRRVATWVKTNDTPIKASIEVPLVSDTRDSTFQAEAKPATDAKSNLYKFDQSYSPRDAEFGYSRVMILAASHMQEGVHPELKQINKNEWEVLPSLKEQATALSRLDDATLEQAIPKTEGRRLKRFLGLKRAESSPVMTLQQFKSLLLQENPSEQNKEILSEAYTNFINNQKKMADSGTVTFSIDETPICKLTKEQALDAYEAFLKEPQEKLDDFMTQLRKLNPTIYSQVQQEKRYQEPPSPPESSSSSSSS